MKRMIPASLSAKLLERSSEKGMPKMRPPSGKSSPP